MSKTKRITLAALFIALCVVLPIAFHSVPNAGSIFLPMHIPVLLAGIICGWPLGLACGILGPILSSLLTGMPPMAYLPSMVCELAVYGLVTGLLINKINTRNKFIDLYIPLIGAMLAGRFVSGVLNALIFRAGNYSMAIWLTSAFVTAIPGIVIQLVLIPFLVFILQKSGLIEWNAKTNQVKVE
jgi:LytS/YehU family sensor histidine kinase